MDKKTKIKIGIVAGVYSLFILVLLTILLEGLGTFVGFLIDRPVAAKYIDKNYSGIKCKFVNAEYVNEKRTVLGVEQKYKTYRFNYKVKSMDGKYGYLKEGDVFSVDAYNFKVTRDSIYMEYNQDVKLLDELNQTLKSDLEKFTYENNAIDFEIADGYVDVKIEAGKFETIDNVLGSDVVKKADQVIHVVGKKCSFDEYKKIIAPFIAYYQQEDKTVPNPENVQIFYYYLNEKGEKVMEYETEFEHYQLTFDENAIIRADKMHYKVELTPDEEKKANFYNIFRIVYICVLGGTVVALYTLWTVRKIKKLMRQASK